LESFCRPNWSRYSPKRGKAAPRRGQFGAPRGGEAEKARRARNGQKSEKEFFAEK